MQVHRCEGERSVTSDQRAARFGMDGRVAVITGAGTGIGRGVALVLAQHGADIVLAARRREPLEQTAQEIEQLGRRALVVPTDVTEVEQCEELVSRAVSEFGRLDVLVNNAGGSTTKPIAEWTPGEWHEIVDLNLGSVWFLSRFAVAPMIEAGKGAIVNISSGSSLFPFPMGAPYGSVEGSREQPDGNDGRGMDAEGRAGERAGCRCGADADADRRRQEVRPGRGCARGGELDGPARRARRDRVRSPVLRVRRVELLQWADVVDQRRPQGTGRLNNR